MKKQISNPKMKNFFFTCMMMVSVGCTGAFAQDTATIRIDKAKAKDAYQQNSDGRKATAQSNSTNRRGTINQNKPARQQTAVENKQERKAAASDGAVTTQEAQNLYSENSVERRTNAQNAAPSRKATVAENSAARKTQVKTAAPKRRAAIIH